MDDPNALEQSAQESTGTFIDLDLTGVAVRYHSVFATAQNKLNKIIRTPKRPVQVGNQIVDTGILIIASVKAIDGPGGILGRAGPTHILKSDGLPVRGIMEFDSADLDSLVGNGRIQDVITHEMLHVTGAGTLWKSKKLISGAGTANPGFTGQYAVGEYRKLQTGNPSSIPVEQDGGAGTRDAHWDEQVFADELMTGYISGGVRPLSRMSIAALTDVGYRVDLSKADDFALLSAAEIAERLSDATTFTLQVPECKTVERLDPQQ